VYVSAVFDAAWSETAAWGRDAYGAFAVRGGIGEIFPLNASFFMDAAGSRFVGTAGSSMPAGARYGGRLEYAGGKQSLYYVQFTLNAAAPQGVASPFGGPVRQGSVKLYCRLPRKTGKAAPVFSLSRVSFEASGDGRTTTLKNRYSLETTARLFSSTLGLKSGLETGRPAGGNTEFESFRLGADASVPLKYVTLKGAFTGVWAASKKKTAKGTVRGTEFEPEASFSAAGSMRLSSIFTGRLTAKISYSGKKEEWKFALNYKLSAKG
jgi:hypothetical protein